MSDEKPAIVYVWDGGFACPDARVDSICFMDYTFFAMDHEQNFLPVEMVEGPPPERADR